MRNERAGETKRCCVRLLRNGMLVGGRPIASRADLIELTVAAVLVFITHSPADSPSPPNPAERN